jgi:hydroxymethylbilane synthase
MRLKLASRQSDLARWQAVQVARKIEQLPEKPSIEFNFKASLGDQDLDTPLASMGSKGVFTEDFYADLLNGHCDLVVHSWKDLPVEDRTDTMICATLKRADMRDVLLVPEIVWQSAIETGALTVLTSSPRRVYNLSACLPELLPVKLRLNFVPVRGNVPTRLSKMHTQGCALVLAKAGLDRLLEAEQESFLKEGAKVRSWIDTCRVQILPLSLNPPAAAQGALAIEVARSNDETLRMMSLLNDAEAFRSVQQERELLRQHGGGCHQKIGVAVMPRPYGVVRALKGITDAQVVLNEWRIENDVPWAKAEHADAVFPKEARDNSWFDRKALPVIRDFQNESLFFVARAEAWPEGFQPDSNQRLWTAGVQTWKRLAKLGIWVNGTQDGLGELEPLGLEQLWPGCSQKTWVKLTHNLSTGNNNVAVYALAPKPPEESPQLRGKTHFFWMSRTAFDRARELFPAEIQSGHHACGPGSTWLYLQSLGLKNPPKAFLGLDQFLRDSVP